MNKTTARALAILDLVDDMGSVKLEDIAARGVARATAGRDVIALVETGLLARVRRGVYGPGPRYRRQAPGTRFDSETRRREMLAKIAEWRAPKRGAPKSWAEIAESLGVCVATVYRLAAAHPEATGRLNAAQGAAPQAATSAEVEALRAEIARLRAEVGR